MDPFGDVLDGANHLGQKRVHKCDTCVLNDVQALTDCHRRGLTHGDVKPQNIMSVREKNGIKLVDFGTASMSDGWHSFYLLL